MNKFYIEAVKAQIERIRENMTGITEDILLCDESDEQSLFQELIANKKLIADLVALIAVEEAKETVTISGMGETLLKYAGPKKGINVSVYGMYSKK